MGRAKYFEHFPVVELQDPFYEPPSVELATKWRASAPPHFRFNVKAWQLITHTCSSPTYRKLKSAFSAPELGEFGCFRPTEHVWLAWERTQQVARILRASVVLFQCPKSFLPTRENIRNLRTFFDRMGPQEWLTAWEPRGDWPADVVSAICTDFNLVHCVDPFQYTPVTEGPIYWLLHGCGTYRYKYSDEELDTVRGMTEGREGYLMFNNVYMRDDALRFLARLQG
jgi:uncharacterized protein YecE (DUF72 family)